MNLLDHEIVYRDTVVSQMFSEARQFLDTNFDNPFVYFKDENIIFEIKDEALLTLNLVYAVGEIERISVLKSYNSLYPIVLQKNRAIIDVSISRLHLNLLVKSEFGESLN